MTYFAGARGNVLGTIGRLARVFRSIGAVLRTFIKRLRIPIPKRIRNSLQRRRRISKPQEYYYLKYAISVLRVIAWVVLTIGFIGSLFWGITTGGFGGGLRIVLGMIGSFLAWLLLLAARELIYLCVHLEKDTRSTTEGIIDKSS